MERLRLIEPPDNIERYTPNSLVRKKRRFPAKTPSQTWIDFFKSRDFTIQWVVPWWKIEKMIGTNDVPFCRIPSLSVLTFYFPSRVMRQYGREQTIPAVTDRKRPTEPFLYAQNIERFEIYWAE